MKTDKMMEVICDEIDKIADKGLSTSNIEIAYKLIDMYKDMKTVEAMDDYDGDSYNSYAMRYDNDSMARGRMRAKRDSMGRYSREGATYEDGGKSYADMMYSKAKRDYRESRAGKSDVMDSLEEKMRELKDELKAMSRESDFPEERQKIDKYVKMLENVM